MAWLLAGDVDSSHTERDTTRGLLLMIRIWFLQRGLVRNPEEQYCPGFNIFKPETLNHWRELEPGRRRGRKDVEWSPSLGALRSYPQGPLCPNIIYLGLQATPM